MTKTPSVEVSINVVLPSGDEVSYRVRHQPMKGEDFSTTVAVTLGGAFSAVEYELPHADEIVAGMVEWLADNGGLDPHPQPDYTDEPLREFITAARFFLDERREQRREMERMAKQNPPPAP